MASKVKSFVSSAASKVKSFFGGSGTTTPSSTSTASKGATTQTFGFSSAQTSKGAPLQTFITSGGSTTRTGGGGGGGTSTITQPSGTIPTGTRVDLLPLSSFKQPNQVFYYPTIYKQYTYDPALKVYSGETRYYDPNIRWSSSGKYAGSTPIERKATAEEQRELEAQYPRAVVASTKKPSSLFVRNISETSEKVYSRVSGGVRERIIKPVTSIKYEPQVSSTIFNVASYPFKQSYEKYLPSELKELYPRSIVKEILMTEYANVKEEPVKYGIIYGATYGLGAIGGTLKTTKTVRQLSKAKGLTFSEKFASTPQLFKIDIKGTELLLKSRGLRKTAQYGLTGTYFGISGYQAATAPTYQESEKILLGSASEFALMNVGFRSGYELTKPLITIKTSAKVIEPGYIKVNQLQIIRGDTGEIKTLEQYYISSRKISARVDVTTKLRIKRGDDVLLKDVAFGREQLIGAKPIPFVQDEEPYYAISGEYTKRGIQTAKVSEITGKIKPLKDIDMFPSYSKENKYLLSELLGQRARGLKIPESNLKQFIKEEDLLSIGFVQQKQTNIKFKKDIGFYPNRIKGRVETYKMAAVTRPRKIKETGDGVYDLFVSFKQERGFRGKAVGKVSSLKGELNLKTIVVTPKGSNIFKRIGEGKKSSPEYFKKLYAQSDKNLGQQSILKLKTYPKISLISIPQQKSVLVGVKKTTSKTTTLQKTSISSATLGRTLFSPLSLQKQGIDMQEKQFVKAQIKQTPKETSILKSASIERVRTIPRMNVKQEVKLTTKQIVKISPKLTTRTFFKEFRFKTPKKRIPEITIPFYLKPVKKRGRPPKRKKSFEDRIFYTPSFTATQLNIKTKIPTSELRRQAIRGYGGFELRKIPA